MTNEENDFGPAIIPDKDPAGNLKARVRRFVKGHRFTYDVFLSHSSKDASFIQQVNREFTDLGFRVFSSNVNLKTNVGASYFEEIQEGLNNSKHFVLLASPESMSSHWVRIEYETFFNHIHIADRKERMLILLKGQNFSLSIVPIFLRNIQVAEDVLQIANSILKTDIPREIKESVYQSHLAPETTGNDTHADKSRDDNTADASGERQEEPLPGLAALVREKQWERLIGLVKENDVLLDKNREVRSGFQSSLSAMLLAEENRSNPGFYHMLRDLYLMHKVTWYKFSLNARNFTLLTHLLLDESRKNNALTEAYYFALELPDDRHSLGFIKEFEDLLPRVTKFGDSPGPHLRVLLVEDDVIMRKRILMMLQENHHHWHVHEVVEAIDGEDGYRQFERYRPDMILTDNVMPRMSGLQMLTKIKKNFDKRNCKIIVVSSYPESDYLLKYIELMVDYFVDKGELDKTLKPYLDQATSAFVLKKELEEKEHALLAKNKEIEDSIKYAVRMQKALMSDISTLGRFFPESFVLFKPKEFLSSDFYWFHGSNGIFYLAMADCSGSNIAGSMMGILCITYLNQFIVRMNMSDPAEVLQNMNSSLIKSLHPEAAEGFTEWLNLALAKIDVNARTLYSAGANLPVYLVENNKVREIPPDYRSVGINDFLDSSFTGHSLRINNKSSLYITTEGLLNQLNDKTGETFGKNRFVGMLNELKDTSMSNQKILIEKKLTQWLGDANVSDDILVIGLKLNAHNGT